MNLGSPDSTSVKDVRKYLNEFLMDGRVIDSPYLLRLLLVKGIWRIKHPKVPVDALFLNERILPVPVDTRRLQIGRCHTETTKTAFHVRKALLQRIQVRPVENKAL